MHPVIVSSERERLRQQHIANELELARKLGRASFRGVNRAVMRNPYRPGPFHDEWQIGREESQYDRPIQQAIDAPLKRAHIYKTDERTVA